MAAGLPRADIISAASCVSMASLMAIIAACTMKKRMYTVKPVLETTCIKRPPALRDHCSDTTTLFKST